jgi:hypothetical protein
MSCHVFFVGRGEGIGCHLCILHVTLNDYDLHIIYIAFMTDLALSESGGGNF